jgi:hypothetical protein
MTNKRHFNERAKTGQIIIFFKNKVNKNGENFRLPVSAKPEC